MVRPAGWALELFTGGAAVPTAISKSPYPQCDSAKSGRILRLWGDAGGRRRDVAVHPTAGEPHVDERGRSAGSRESVPATRCS